MNPKGIGIVSIPDRKKAIPILQGLITWLLERDITVYLDTDTSALFLDELPLGIHPCPIISFPEDLDLIVLFGGDGTLLRAARLIGEYNIPMLGVNLGSLGFLTDIKTDEVIPTLQKVFEDKYTIDERMMLRVTVTEAVTKKVLSTFALNDVVINNRPHSRLIKLAASVNGEWINNFLSDGLIIATPTGSTAYSLSAGGPIVHPRLHSILLTPICPHILTNRPIVIPDKGKIDVVIPDNDKANDEGGMLSVDGQILTQIKQGDLIEISKASHTLKLLQPPDRNYYQILRTKLKWGERG